MPTAGAKAVSEAADTVLTTVSITLVNEASDETGGNLLPGGGDPQTLLAPVVCLSTIGACRPATC